MMRLVAPPRHGRFIALSIFTAIGVVVLFFAASYFLVIRYVAPRDNLTKSLHLLLTTRSDSAAFGDSRIAFDFSPPSHVANLAYVGETVADISKRAGTWLKRQKHPRTILLQADPHLFSQYRIASEPKSYLGGREKGWIRLPIDEHHLPLLLSYWRTFLLRGGFGQDRFAFQPTGWEINTERFEALSPFERKVRATARVHEQTPAAGFPGPASLGEYRALLAKLRRSGASLCLVTTPVSAPYFESARSNPKIIAALQVFSDIAKQNGARYVNAFGWFVSSADIRFFADPDHLNEEGAQSFSARLENACRFGKGRF